MFLYNILLALAWVLITGRYTPVDFAFGFALGFVVLYLGARALGPEGADAPRYFSRTWAMVMLAWVFAEELVRSGLRVAWVVMQPKPRVRPGILALPIDVRSEVELTVLASLLTLTPGTLSLDVSEDRRRLFIHVFDVDDPEALRDEIEERFARRVRNAMG